MRVAVIIPGIRHAGPVKVIETLTQYIALYPDIRMEVFHLDRITEGGFNISVPLKHLVVKQFPFEDYDIIHTNGIRSDLFAFVHRKKIRYHISTIHNFVFKDLRYSYNRLISIVFGLIWFVLWSRADKLVCVSYAQKKFYSKWINPDKLLVIHNGISESPNDFQPDTDIIGKVSDFRLRGLKIIGTVSAITRGKGLEQVIPLLVKDSNLVYIVIGDGKGLRKLKKTAQRLNVLDRCYFPGFREHAINYFRYFDLIIMPSRSEGFCLALVESVSLKKPVLCSDIDVFRELFTWDEVTFFKIDDLPDLIQSFGEASRHGYLKTEPAFNHFKKEYTGKVMVSKYYELYNAAVK